MSSLANIINPDVSGSTQVHASSVMKNTDQVVDYAQVWAELMQRYRCIVPDWQAFMHSLQQPLPTCCWSNPLKIEGQQLFFLLKQQGYDVSALAWHPHAYQVQTTKADVPALGRSWLYLSGLLQIQDQASMLAGVLVGAQPGETVLDLCAAPGNKTAQIAIAMQNCGTLIANDRSYQRLRALGQINKRMGLLNLTCSSYDGVNFPASKATFDRVLVDAPCSCQGTTRKRYQNPPKALESAKQLAQLSAVQKSLLRRAVQLTKPGGLIIYSTCTYSPEENEAVVDAMLAEFPQQLTIEPRSLEHWQSSPGLTAWGEHNFSQQLTHSMRVWPQQNNSGGFFIACIRKSKALRSVLPVSGIAQSLGPVRATKSTSAEAQFVGFQSWEDLASTYAAPIQQHFGFAPAVFAAYKYHSTGRGCYMLCADHALLHGLRHDASGMLLVKSGTRFPKLSTTAAMLLGQYATRQIIILNQAQIEAYIRQRPLQVARSQLLECGRGGYVLIRYRELNLGLGLIKTAQLESGQPLIDLSSLFPQSWQGGEGGEGSKGGEHATCVHKTEAKSSTAAERS